MSLRSYFCRRCKEWVTICSRCDRGNIYCNGPCSDLARREDQRESEHRYRNSPLGHEQANIVREINASLSADREPLALAWATGSDSNCNVLHTWRSFWVSCCGGPEHPYSGFMLAS